ncbi:hypothetical protein HN415_06125 [Candidatus Woesearchaeota archaeon]|nr:hypothetical protein [Candidatus Woesearchaeota archaeon]MBT4387355.1 hypothetical protein [Candidatus Woesearchaeota archaeon]MBT5740680.1 hypothetical protein [Candidatus Woesearchaeota archaeon]MBT7962436.1 hypothetical protein [Candidatus Woesearchaeota archaeon]
MTGDLSRQTLAVLVAVVLVLSVVGTWMVMSGYTTDTELRVNEPEAVGTLEISMSAPETDSITGQVVVSFNDNKGDEKYGGRYFK